MGGSLKIVLPWSENWFTLWFFSLLQVKNWVKELKKMLGSEICLIIAGNKVDLEKQRNVSVQDAEE